jgi:hypothetical protein
MMEDYNVSGRWSEHDVQRDVNKIRAVLEKEGKTWGQLIEETGIPGTRMKRRLDHLIYDLKEVKTKPVHRDRRKTLYYLRNKDETQNERQRFEEGQFIEDMKHPIASHNEHQGVSYSMYLQLQTEDRQERRKMKKELNQTIKILSEGMFTKEMKRLTRKSKAKKLAVIVAIST